MKKFLTLDLGRGWMSWAIVTDEQDKSETDNGKIRVESETDRNAVFDPIIHLAEQYTDISGICLTMPGVIDSETGTAYSGGIYSWVSCEPLAREIYQLTNKKTIIVNDAKAAAYAEIGFGSLKKVQNGVMLMILGTGIGGAIVRNGRIINGSHFAAGEFSYLGGDYKDPKGGDMFALALSINSLTEIVKEYTGNPKMNTLKIFYGLQSNNPEIEKGVKIYCDRFANFIYNIQCVVDVDRFVISGNISEEQKLVDMIRKSVEERFENARYHNIFVPEIHKASFSTDSRKYGAVYLYGVLDKEGKIDEYLGDLV